jgi:hypothetical protein
MTAVGPLLLAASCGGGGGDLDAGGSDSGTDSETDTGTDISGLDCAFDVAEGPFEIKSVTSGHVAFPDVTRLPGGDILLVYRQATTHGVDPAGAIVAQIGTPDGLAWSPSGVLVDVDDVDDRDPSVTTLASGDLALSYFQYVYQGTADGDLGVHQIFFSLSQDEGETWSVPAMVPSGAGYAMDYPGAAIGSDQLWADGSAIPVMVTACSNDPVETGGEVLVQSYGGYAWNTSYSGAPRSRISLFASGDGGATWSERPIAPDAETGTWLQEPALLALDDQRWIVHLRTAAGSSPGNGGAMWQIRSFDGGQTWGDYEKFDFIGHAPFLYRLSNGVIVSAFRWLNSSFTSTNVGFIHSTDGGETWSDVAFVLDPQTVEVGYPSVLELDGDRMLVVYYVGGYEIGGVIYEFQLSDAR